jgi:hypothetical protein
VISDVFSISFLYIYRDRLHNRDVIYGLYIQIKDIGYTEDGMLVLKDMPLVDVWSDETSNILYKSFDSVLKGGGI